MTVRELLGERGEHWTQGGLASDEHGRAVSPEWKTACKWCVEGAIIKVYGDWNGRKGLRARKMATKHLPDGYHSLAYFNDHSSWEKVRALIDAAGI